MSKKRGNPSAEFRSRIVLLAIKGDKRLIDLSQQYNVATTTLNRIHSLKQLKL